MTLRSAAFGLASLAALAGTAAKGQSLGADVTPTADVALDSNNAGTLIGANNNFFVSTLTDPLNGPDVAFRFVPPFAGEYTFRAVTYNAADAAAAQYTDVALYLTGDLGAGSLVDITPLSTGAASARADFGFRLAEQVTFTLPAGVTVFAIIDRSTAPSNTSFPFFFEVTRTIREQEPNDTTATAGAPFPGLVGTAITGDVDFFKLGTVAANRRIFAAADCAAAPATDVDIRVTTALDTIEFDREDGAGNHTGQGAPVIAGAVMPATGEAFVRVNRRGADDGPYRLYAFTRPDSASLGGAASSDVSSDSLPATTATATTFADNYVRGSINVGGDQDVIRVDVQSGDIVIAALDCNPQRAGSGILDARLELLDAAGDVIVSVDGNDVAEFQGAGAANGLGNLAATAPSSSAEVIVFRATATGALFVRVRGFGGSDTGEYLLAVSLNGDRPAIALGGGDLTFVAPDSSTTTGPKSFTVNGKQLTSDITVTAPSTHFQVRNATTGGSFAASATVANVAGTASATIEVQYLPGATAAQPPHQGAITATATDAFPRTVNVRGEFPSIQVSTTTLPAFSSFVSLPSAPSAFAVLGTGLSGSILVTATSEFEVAFSQFGVNPGSFAASQTISPQGGTIFVRMVAGSPGAKTGTITCSNGSLVATVSVTGDATRAIVLNPSTLSAFTAVLGGSSPSQPLTVTGFGLVGGINVTTTAGFEISFNSAPFGQSAAMPSAGGNVEVRFTPGAVGTFNGTVTFSGASVNSSILSVSGTAFPAGGGGGGGGCHAGIPAGAAAAGASLTWLSAVLAAGALRLRRRR